MADRDHLNDAALTRLMSAASRPEPPPGATERIMQAVADAVPTPIPSERAAVPGAQSVVAPFTLPVRRHWSSSGNLSAATALAASLALGLYLGASGSLQNIIPPSLGGDQTEEVVFLDDPFDLGRAFSDAGTDEL